MKHQCNGIQKMKDSQLIYNSLKNYHKVLKSSEPAIVKEYGTEYYNELELQFIRLKLKYQRRAIRIYRKLHKG